MRTIGILQPSYLPWLGYFDQIMRSDVFVFYDDVQYDKNGWRNRNRIKTVNGVQWLTIPVLLKGKEFPLIKDVAIDQSQNWVKKHVAAIEQSYGKCEYYDTFICDMLQKYSWKWLWDVDTAMINLIMKYLDIDIVTPLSWCIPKSEDTIQRLIDIIKYCGGDTFIEGSAGRDYIDPSVFKLAGIDIIFQDYKHPTYEQRHGDFVSHLSIIDVLFNCGKEETLRILKGGSNG